jgi:hypothetical protein
LQAPKINITIRNGSKNQLTCGTLKDNKFNGFLYLEGKRERNFEAINEDEYIGCSIRIDDRSNTILNWFTVTASGDYTMLLEQVACKTCKGTDKAWANIVVRPNGKREYRDI